jgi:Zn-finger nucleic acid-binding protein
MSPDQRFICGDCGTKWFVPEGREIAVDHCPRCEGPLRDFAEPEPSVAGEHGGFAHRGYADLDRGAGAG